MSSGTMVAGRNLAAAPGNTLGQFGKILGDIASNSLSDAFNTIRFGIPLQPY